MNRNKALRITAFLAMILLFATGVFALMQVPVKAVERKKVRVGWHEAPHFTTDEYGKRSGYSYDYLLKIAAYTGWIKVRKSTLPSVSLTVMT